ncbi:hypothetical protein BDV95DRAFT_603188 [Massariosphaeria phaeospora]|uniref:Uncharacterized protein n=1 Tax=Massariosphaeria phaeospora TaxID=100035 RepID=A0A7C8MV58_9PLEO|nr:hypothetical protein BDV95DRAFT_603188 [Massariosphaeria phaeospora]
MAFTDPLQTLGLCIAVLIFGLPVAAIAIFFEKVFVPNVVLGTKEIDIGPGGTKTITFDLMTGSEDAVFAGAYISIISSLLIAGGIVLVRHISKHSVWGWVAFGSASANVLGQIACVAAAFIFHGRYPEATSTEQVRFEGGSYNTGGTLFTRESWACTMKNLYSDREGVWASKACTNLATGRYMTIALVVCSGLLSIISYWQIRQSGGLAWLFARRGDTNAPKGEFTDLEK